jgi:hypothetical protein
MRQLQQIQQSVDKPLHNRSQPIEKATHIVREPIDHRLCGWSDRNFIVRQPVQRLCLLPRSFSRGAWCDLLYQIASLLQLFILTRILSENRFTLFGMRFDSLPTKE